MSGVTSRTLRHYDAVGLLPPARVGADGRRHYGRKELLRLQRILLLREGESVPAGMRSAPAEVAEVVYAGPITRVAAEGASCLWNPPLRGGSSVSGQARGNKKVIGDFEVITFNSGGTGARPAFDGLDATAFPSGVRTMPVEATENVAPIVIWRKELREGSAGAGRTRGGLGQTMEIATKGELEFAVNATFDRIANAPKGRDGGGLGANGAVTLKTGEKLRTKGYQVIPNGNRLILHMPGGGGMGDPATRAPALVARDVRDGVVSVEDARDLYSVIVSEHGIIDDAATAALRN